MSYFDVLALLMIFAAIRWCLGSASPDARSGANSFLKEHRPGWTSGAHFSRFLREMGFLRTARLIFRYRTNPPLRAAKPADRGSAQIHAPRTL